MKNDPPFLLQICPKLCYFIHKYACLLPERSAKNTGPYGALHKRPHQNQAIAQKLLFHLLHIYYHVRRNKIGLKDKTNHEKEIGVTH